MPDSLLPRPDDTAAHRIEQDSTLELGQWYWVKFRRRRQVRVNPAPDDPVDSGYDIEYDAERKDDEEASEEAAGEDDEEPQWRTVEEEYEALCCVVDIGSNHVKVEYPSGDRHRHVATRIHFDRFYARCRHEPDPAGAIRKERDRWIAESRRLLGAIQQVCQRLGVGQSLKIGMQPDPTGQGTYTLAALNRQPDVESYREQLILAKDEELPTLYKELKEAQTEAARWMQAELLPLYAQQKEMREIVEEVEGRVFNVRLYAGLIEDIVTVCKGEPAPIGSKLHVMQRRHYMDEECLLAYETGGMEFSGIARFDAWLARPANFARLLPHPRTVLAFRVRRHGKYRGNLSLHPFVRFDLENADKLTFLYIRNGERLYRLSTELDFGHKLFPDTSVFSSGQPLWARVEYNNSVGEFITQGDYEERQKEVARLREKEAAQQRLADQWAQEHPEADEFDNPHRRYSGRADDKQRALDDYQPFDPSSVWFDDMHAAIAEEVRQYNRIALLLQGLFDRSEVLHPHPPVRLWDASGFDAALVLVRDSDRALYPGPPPDLDAYLERINSTLGEGSVTFGQYRFWGRQEATRENARRLNLPHRYRDRECELTFYEPWGNPGPGDLARIVKWRKRARKARYEWTRERQVGTWEHGRREPIPCSLEVPATELFNVSAYRPGDYKPFFEDPRTREQYLEWAPMMLLAEEYHAGNRRVGPEGQEEPWRTPNGEYPEQLIRSLGQRLHGTTDSIPDGLARVEAEAPDNDLPVIERALKLLGYMRCASCNRWVDPERAKVPWVGKAHRRPAPKDCFVCVPPAEDSDDSYDETAPEDSDE